jgi:hypothetical protein
MTISFASASVCAFFQDFRVRHLIRQPEKAEETAQIRRRTIASLNPSRIFLHLPYFFVRKYLSIKGATVFIKDGEHDALRIAP